MAQVLALVAFALILGLISGGSRGGTDPGTYAAMFELTDTEQQLMADCKDVFKAHGTGFRIMRASRHSGTIDPERGCACFARQIADSLPETTYRQALAALFTVSAAGDNGADLASQRYGMPISEFESYEPEVVNAGSHCRNPELYAVKQ